MELRPYDPDDLPHLLEICLLTGDSGRDARGVFSDPWLVGQYYAAPYPSYDSSLCLTLVDTEGPCGYIVGAADTCAFLRWFNQEWLPPLRTTYRGARPRRGARDAWLYKLLRSRATAPECVVAYPAHLHIDLLPRAQRRGWGRRMISAWTELAAARGAHGVHLGVSTSNTNAIAFYERIGFRRLASPEGALLLGLPLASEARPAPTPRRRAQRTGVLR